jgi:colanic acid/amylovoran biosynthesis glycosyltransferase
MGTQKPTAVARPLSSVAQWSATVMTQTESTRVASAARQTVAHLVGSYLSSTATFVYHYISAMSRYRPVVLAPFTVQPERFPFPDLYTPDLSQVQILLLKTMRRLFHRQRMVEPFYLRVIRDQNVSLLHAHFGTVGVFSLPVVTASGLPLVTTFYGFDMSRLGRSRTWVDRYQRLFREGHLFLVEGSHMAQNLEKLGCPRHKVCIQRIGVDLDKFSYRPPPSTKDNIRILMCGRFVEKKGFEYGIRAFARIRSEFPRSQLRLVGDGPLRPYLEQLIQDLSLQKHTVLLGALPYNAYSREAMDAHVLLAPSVTAASGDSEGGAPTVLLEMQARGIPVVSTRHADIPEVVLDGASGYLVPERDEEALSEKLAELLDNPESWEAMGRAGRAHMEKQHDIVKLAQDLEYKYDRILASHAKARDD